MSTDAEASRLPADDLSREVYAVLGVPIDALDMPRLVNRIEIAAAARKPLLISTVNVNFLVASLTNAEFKESLLKSDLCTADGMPLVWIARLLGVPLKGRIAGADLFEGLKSTYSANSALKIFLFGGEEGRAAAACEKLNAESSRVVCCGSYNPGFGSVAEMSADAVIDAINASNADFLVAALGAGKGQAWLLRNHARLHIPVRAHLGATINIQAGTVRRAPAWMQTAGLEWLWRINEEPQLWNRYWHDARVLLRLLVRHVMPLATSVRWRQFRARQRQQAAQAVTIERSEDPKTVTLKINGVATAGTIGVLLPHFQYAAATSKDVVINFSDTRLADARFLGLLLMLDKALNKQNRRLGFTGIPPHIGRIFRLNGFGHLHRI